MPRSATRMATGGCSRRSRRGFPVGSGTPDHRGVVTMTAAEQFHVSEISPSYWRVTFDNGPVNLLDPDTVEQLGALLQRIEEDPNLTVVVFRSEKPGYFMAHWDFLADNARVLAMQPGRTGLHPYLDNFV